MIAWRRLAFSAFLLASAGLLVLTLVRVAERGRFARPYSSYGSGAQGTRALFLLLGELGYPLLRWSQDLARLPPQSTLIALGSCQSPAARPLSRYETTELVGFIERGGVLLVAGARNYLPAQLGVRFEDDADCDASHRQAEEELAEAVERARSERAQGADAGQPLTADAGVPEPIVTPQTLAADGGEPLWAVPLAKSLEGLPIVQFDKPGKLLVEDFTLAEPLLGVPPTSAGSDTDVASMAIIFTRGRGRVIVLSSASMLQNAELDASEGATLFTRLLRAYANPQLLIFDEYHLGLGERRSLMQYLRNAGAMPLIVQLLCVLACGLWRRGARVGTAQSAPRGGAAQPSGTISFVTALGALYRRVGDRGAAVRLIARAALQRVAQHHALGNLQASALERELTRRGALRAATAVREIVSAGSSAPSEPLPAIVKRIDLAVFAALSEQSGWTDHAVRVEFPSGRPRKTQA